MRSLVFIGAGITLGAALTYAAFLLAGFGHGTLVPLALVASPLLLATRIQPALFFPALFLVPFYWGALGWSAAQRHRRLTVVLLVAQYIGAALATIWAQESAHSFLRMAKNTPALLAATLIAYVIAHVWIWRRLFARDQA